MPCSLRAFLGTIGRGDLQQFYRLATRLIDWPLLLKLAAGVIGARLDRNDTFDGALDYVSRAYERHGLTAFDPKDAQKRNDAFAKSIQASLELLDKDEQARLAELAIFPDDADVPLRMVELLWTLDDLDIQDTTKRGFITAERPRCPLPIRAAARYVP